MPYKRKTTDEWQLWLYMAQGWKEVAASESFREIRDLTEDYRKNQPEFSRKIVLKRIPINKEETGP